MPIEFDSEHFAGKPIKFFRVEEGIIDPASIAYNIRYLDEERNGPPFWKDKWFVFINDPRVSEVTSLVIGGDGDQIGMGESCEMQIECLVSGRKRLPALTSLFFEGNNLLYDDETWLYSLPDVSPIFLAFPQLEVLGLYGWSNHPGAELQIGTIHSEVLRELTIATGWLAPRILHDLWRAQLPTLEHLELWLHDPKSHPNPPTVADLEPLFSGKLFPRLRSLTLCLSHMEDDLAIVLAASPLLAQLKVLKLSMGILTDRGAQALVASPTLRRLEKLIIHHHYCSAEMMQQVRALPLEVEIDEPVDVRSTLSGDFEIDRRIYLTYT